MTAFVFSLLPSIASASVITIIMPDGISIGSIDRYCASPVRTYLAINDTSMREDITSRFNVVSQNSFQSINYDLAVRLDAGTSGSCDFTLSTGFISYTGTVSSTERRDANGMVQEFKINAPLLPSAISNLVQSKLQGKVDAVSGMLKSGALDKFQNNFEKPIEELIATFLATTTPKPFGEVINDPTVSAYSFDYQHIRLFGLAFFLMLMAILIGFPVSIIVSLIRNE